jgi:outer membrane cobalamin receptor
MIRMGRIKRILFSATLFLIIGNTSFAQVDTTKSVDLSEIDFADLLKVKIAINKEQTLEEAPSIVSVITKKEMEAFGCRDIADVLRLVPGFGFGIDVLGIAGLSFRGIWVHEGKVLLMLNGLTLNDQGFGNYNFIGTLPIALIQRVEIIRGPGSALYGGLAEVCVINIITNSSEKINGIVITSNGGLVGNKGYAGNANLFASGDHDGLKYNINTGYSDKPLSTREYRDFFGNSYQMDNTNSYRKFKYIITEISNKGLTFNLNHTSLDANAKDGTYMITHDSIPLSQSANNFTNNGISIKYDAKINSKFVITPLAEYLTGTAITANYSSNSALPNLFSSYATERLYKIRGQLIAQYNFGKVGELAIGGGYVRDMAKNLSFINTPGLYSPQGDTVNSVSAASRFALIQHVIKLKKIQLTIGTRYENTYFGDAVAPRVGVTYAKNKFNAKLLYGDAFRIPTLWQAYSRELTFVVGQKLKAEKSNTLEFEIGYKFTPHLSAKMNAYHINISKPIVYDGYTNSYLNYGNIQSKGVEAELSARYSKCNAFMNFSYNLPSSKTSAGFLTGDRKYFLGAPIYKINFGGYCELKKITLSPTFTFLSKRYGESQDNALGLTTDYENTGYDPILLTNMSITYKGLLKKIDVNLSVYNLADQKFVLIQPYYGAHAPLPTNDRQIMLGVKLNL